VPWQQNDEEQLSEWSCKVATICVRHSRVSVWEHLPPGRKGTRWERFLQTLCTYRFIDPGSEWRLHRYWFDRNAVADLLGSDFRLAESHRLYGCHDLLLKHKGALFTHLTERWKDLFNAKFEVLLYDLTKLVAFCTSERQFLCDKPE
jgi:hypothetical protein